MDQLVFEYLNGKLHGHIHDLRFHQGENTVSEGNGPLLIGENQRLMIEICAPAPLGEDPQLLSGLADRSRPVQFSGSFVGTPIRQPFKVQGTLGGGLRGHCAAANNRWWRHYVDGIEFQFRSTDLGRCRFHGVVQPWPNYALSLSRGVIKDENALFGEVVAHYHCWSFDFGNFRIAIRDNAIHRVGEIVAEGPSSEGQSIEKLADAILKGISLRWGYEMEWLCNSFEIQDLETFRLYPDALERKENHRWHKPPVVVGPFQDGTNERFLACAVRYFLKDDDIELFKYLRLFWRTGPAGSLELRESVVGAAIEGIAKQVLRKRATEEQRKEMDCVEQSFRELKKSILGHIEGSSAITSNEHYDSVRKSIESLDYRVAKQLIIVASNVLGFSVTNDELKSWADLRNAAAHGRNVYVDIDSKRLHDFETCVTLLNKFSMALIGYEGYYQDYAHPDGNEQFKLIGRSRAVSNGSFVDGGLKKQHS